MYIFFYNESLEKRISCQSFESFAGDPGINRTRVSLLPEAGNNIVSPLHQHYQEQMPFIQDYTSGAKIEYSLCSRQNLRVAEHNCYLAARKCKSHSCPVCQSFTTKCHKEKITCTWSSLLMRSNMACIFRSVSCVINDTM